MKKLFLAGLILALVTAGLLIIKPGQSKEIKGHLVMYKSPDCGCCTGHLAYLRSSGYQVDVVPTENMSQIKADHGIPREMESCHTLIADNYFIEGHVPIEAIDKLLTEKPDIQGIALPDMPSGSPGMPGYKKEAFKILSLVNSQVKDWLEI